MSDIRPIHGDKLRALLQNPKLPHSEQSRIEVAFQQYTNWRSSLFMVTGNFEDKTNQLVALLNDYKLYLDLEIIYDSEDDFIYRQKGQLKLDNTAIEEFLPIFISQLLGDEMANYGLNFGATTCFSSLYFSSSLLSQESGAGIKLRQKNQDFVISRPLYLQASHFSDWRDSITHQTQIAYLAMECKTNLDKTMFQEASATASDLKLSVPSAKYYLLCEWLDMTPISSSTTAIDEVLILRKAKRLPSNIRNSFNTTEGRKLYREQYTNYLKDNPFATDVFLRLAYHIKDLLSSQSEDDVLTKGHF